MTKIEYLKGLIARTDNWYHRHIYQTQVNRLEGKTVREPLPSFAYFMDSKGIKHYEQI